MKRPGQELAMREKRTAKFMRMRVVADLKEKLPTLLQRLNVDDAAMLGAILKRLEDTDASRASNATKNARFTQGLLQLREMKIV